MSNYFSLILTLIRDNKHFLITYCLIAICFLFYISISNKGDEIILINQYHNEYNDFFFKYSSIIAEGTFYGVFLLILGFFRFKYFFNGVITFLLAGGVTQILKRIFNLPRPKAFLEESIFSTLNFVEGVKIHSSFSFPSGHSTAAFSMMFFLSLITPNKYVRVLFAIIASIMGLSRVYLFQHFLVDVLVGSFIGIIVTLIVYKLVLVQKKIVLSKWYNFSLIEILFKHKF